MLTLRLQRGGKKGQPHFRVVLQEHTDAVKREAKEVLGYYQPAVEPKVLKIDLERVKHWISQGAKPSDSLAVLLKKEGLEGMDQYIAPRDKKKKKKGEQPEEAAPAVAPAAAAPAEEAVPAEEPAPAEAPAPAAETPVEAAPTEEAPAEEEKPAE